MFNNWFTENHRIYLPGLFEQMGYLLRGSEGNYSIYGRKTDFYVVLFTDEGYVYYKVQRPEEKLRATDLIMEFVAKEEDSKTKTIWGKVDSYLEDALKSEELVFDESFEHSLIKVDMDFNHFHTYIESKNPIKDEFYSDVQTSHKFAGRIGVSNSNEILFPLYNIQNEVCGYFSDTGTGIKPYKESAIGNSLWYSNIPNKIEWLIVFKDPKEALAFDKKFLLKNVVYLALGEINHRTAKILFQIQRLAKVKKIVLSFTGTKKIEGYLRDLHFISFINNTNFLLSLNERDLTVEFPMGEEKLFSPFYNNCRRFNRGLVDSFLKFNKVLNQTLIDQNSILVSKEDEIIKVRIPLEVNAIKYFVWNYYKYYLRKSLDILKPKQSNWILEWEATQTIQLKGKEVLLEDYRIAL